MIESEIWVLLHDSFAYCRHSIDGNDDPDV